MPAMTRNSSGARRAATGRAREGDEDENYFVSLTDLMTGVVFIFVILLCAFAFHYRTAQRSADLAQRSAEMAKKEAIEAKASAAAEARAAEIARASALEKARKIEALTQLLRQRDVALREVLERLVVQLAQEGVRVQLDPANGVLRLPDDLLFDPGSDALKPKGIEALRVLARQLAPVLREGSAEGSTFRLEAVFVEGHTDNRPIRTERFADNWELSTARATGTYRTLMRAEPGLESFRNPAGLPVVGVSGYGENRNVAENSTEEGRARNRRIDVRFLMANPSEAEINRVRAMLGEAPGKEP